MEHLLHGNIFHAQHHKGQKKNPSLMGIVKHNSCKKQKKHLHSPLPFRIRRDNQFHKRKEKRRQNQKFKQLLSFVQPQPLGNGQQDKKAEIAYFFPCHLHAVFRYGFLDPIHSLLPFPVKKLSLTASEMNARAGPYCCLTA